MKKIKRLSRRLRDYAAYVRVFSMPEMKSSYEAHVIDPEDEKLLQQAKELHAATYLRKGFVEIGETINNIIHETADPHQAHSTYFAVLHHGKVVATARQILYKGEGEHHDSFPVLQNAIIYERSRRRIENHHPTHIVEISALSKKSGESAIVPLVLYRCMWQYSRTHDHSLWVMACDIRLFERLKLLFGPTLVKIGKRTAYKGGDVIPIALDIAASQNYVARLLNAPMGTATIFNLRRRAARFMRYGVLNV
jgi:hypothetical protein